MCSSFDTGLLSRSVKIFANLPYERFIFESKVGANSFTPTTEKVEDRIIP